jgi:hypothetical protein
MRFQLGRLAAVVAIIATVGACSHNAKRAGDSDDLHPTTRVHVENQAFLDMNVFVLTGGGGRTRLGTVTGNTNQDFVIPEYVVGPANSVRFFVEPIGSNRTPISDEISIRPGETVTLTIPPNG